MSEQRSKTRSLLTLTSAARAAMLREQRASRGDLDRYADGKLILFSGVLDKKVVSFELLV